MNIKKVGTALVVLTLSAVGFFAPKSARTQTAVYDRKMVPGAMCRTTNANYDWIENGTTTYMRRSDWVVPSMTPGTVIHDQPGPFPGVPFVSDPNDPVSYVQIGCPLLRDNTLQTRGVENINVDVEHRATNAGLSLECWSYECTTPVNGVVYCCKGPHATLTAPAGEHYYQLAVSLPASCYGSTNYSITGYAGVSCTYDIGTDFLGVRYSELAGNNQDW